MKMNDQQQVNIVTQFFAWLAAIASAAGITTQDLIYIAFGAIGVLVSVLSFVLGRIDARAKRKQEERRTELYADYLRKRSGRAGTSVDEADQYTPLPGGESEA
ncbi:hypothetical protein QZR43_09910 [Serratia marcescens]|uniref:hypothetical protein n=1 Tax=Serratia marcescens TaxID=615 RepID=UPI00274D1107|nr:hypothetical protein [Serratia marcescens]MDP8772899.1 hypothetical protein [Serratia marcescens]MDP8803305.1 hypothetical protein [Serratia marcescens]